MQEMKKLPGPQPVGPRRETELLAHPKLAMGWSCSLCQTRLPLQVQGGGLLNGARADVQGRGLHVKSVECQTGQWAAETLGERGGCWSFALSANKHLSSLLLVPPAPRLRQHITCPARCGRLGQPH